MAEALGRDPEKFRVKEALPHIESLYARYFEGYPMLMTFSQSFTDRLMTMYFDYLYEYLTLDEIAHKLMLTGYFNSLISRFQLQIE